MPQRSLSSLSRREFVKSTAASLAAAAPCASALRAVVADERPDVVDAPKFARAEPVWARGRELEMNVALRFVVELELADATARDGAILRSTGSSFYRLRVNGRFVGCGPARGPKGWFRVDELAVGAALRPGRNRIELDVSGYNSVSYYLLDQPAFIQAELVDGTGAVLATTSAEETNVARFVALDYTGVRVQKVQRHGWHRAFIETYDLTKERDVAEVELARRPDVPLLPRRVPYPEYAILPVVAWGRRGKTLEKDDFKPWRGAPLTSINDKFKGYKLDELELILTDELMRLRTEFVKDAEPLGFGATYRAGDAQIVDFGVDAAGFWTLDVDSEEGAEIAIAFDEILSPQGDVNFMRCNTCNAVKWTIPPGTANRTIETFDPQAARYVKIYCLKGSFVLRNFVMREYAHPAPKNACFECSDPQINRIFDAAVLTFRSNAVDVFTDCPHRERAGWMCDSFFTARAAFDLNGSTDVERAVFENYALPKSFPNLPDGALPMCYPSDLWHGQFIPNWMMWFVLELEEYYARSRDRATVDALRERVEKEFEFFAQYENSDGLLEKLPNRVFVEWSDANKFLQDVNYPTNMLYAACLDAAARLYDLEPLRDKARRARDAINAQAFDGEFYVDHARREKDGSLTVLKDDKSEVCQYFAFFFKTATPESRPELWKKLLDEFGPDRAEKGLYPEVRKANAFVGNMLRFELLDAAGRDAQIIKEVAAYYAHMAERTGTLWENTGASASCNHGFASHVARILYRNALGVADVDPTARVVKLRTPQIDALQWAKGAIATPDGPVEVSWERIDQKIQTKFAAPDGWTAGFSS